jgi:hypothetical protein
VTDSTRQQKSKFNNPLTSTSNKQLELTDSNVGGEKLSKKGEQADFRKKERTNKNEAEEIRSPLPTKDSFENE